MIVHLMIPHPHCFVFRAIQTYRLVTAFSFDSAWVCSSIIVSASARDDHEIESIMILYLARRS